MTTVVSMICADGIVMGSDTKVVGAGMKWSENKLDIVKFGKSWLVVGGAGSVRHVRDAITWMGLDDLDSKMGKEYMFNKFLDTVVERSMPSFVQDFILKYSREPELNMLIGCIDEKRTPHLIEVYPNGDYDRIDNFTAVGSGGIFGEILLRKLYSPEITIELAEKVIAYIIWEIQEIDNDSGEDMQIVCLGKDKTKHEATPLEISTYKQLPRVIRKPFESLRQELQDIDLESIKGAIENLNKALNGL